MSCLIHPAAVVLILMHLQRQVSLQGKKTLVSHTPGKPFLTNILVLIVADLLILGLDAFFRKLVNSTQPLSDGSVLNMLIKIRFRDLLG